jgi:hypothetical protein
MINACRAGFALQRRYQQPCSVIHKKPNKIVLSRDFMVISLKSLMKIFVKKLSTASSSAPYFRW